MSAIEVGLQLVQGVYDGNLDAVNAALQAGANVDGYTEQPYPPLVGAIFASRVGMVVFLLGQGADPDIPVATELPRPGGLYSGNTSALLGERALHVAARSGKVELVRLLLNRSRADPNVIDYRGRTPLMATCDNPRGCVEVVRLLLEAGADPALAEEGGHLPLHLACLNGHVDFIDMLYAGAPATLNRYAGDGQTALFWACGKGHESIVSKLLKLGARQRMPLTDSDMCPLLATVSEGFAGVVRVLVSEGGMEAIGGGESWIKGLYVSVHDRQARVLRLLLTGGGEEERSTWANVDIGGGTHLLHHGAAYFSPAVVSVLLEAGADEATRDPEGRTPRDVIGFNSGRNGEPQMDRGKEVAIRRMLERGPAYRARSWAWPSDEEEDAGGSGDGDTTTAAVISSSPAVKTPPVVGVRIFRPKENSSGKFFGMLIGRYCVKD